MTLPNFFIVGAMKAGTTWLSFNLDNHPQVFIPKKELHYFSNSKNLKKGLRWYESQFSKSDNTIAIGEKTAGYLLLEQVPGLIHDLVPNAKIIIVLRDPVTRAISQINHHIRYGLVPPDLNSTELIKSKKFKKIDQNFSILERGRYLGQIKRYHQIFGTENVFILINELDIQQNSTQTLVNVCDFLSIDSSVEFPKKTNRIHENRNSKLGVELAYNFPALRPLIAKIDIYIPGKKIVPFKIDVDEKKKMYELYSEDNKKLFDYLGMKLPSQWVYS